MDVDGGQALSITGSYQKLTAEYYVNALYLTLYYKFLY